MKTTNRIIRYTILTFLIVIGIALTIFGFNDSLISVKYQEDNSVNYKVFLKDNNYFESKYLEENRTYITSIIDYLQIQYRYNLEFSEKVTGKCTYYIKASIFANKPNGENGYYWSKDFILVKPKSIDVDNQENIHINEIINVDYGEYDKKLEEFKKDYSIQTDGLLKVQLVVKNNVRGKTYTNDIIVPANLSLSVPLLEKAVEASIEKNAVSNDNTLVMVDYVKGKIRLVCRIIGIFILFLVLLLIIRIIIVRNNNRREHLYASTLKKFVDAHDSIIANVTNLPDTENYNIVKVSSFEELIDVYNEVRMPINFYENKRHDKAVFMIINESMCWEYILDKDSIENKR